MKTTMIARCVFAGAAIFAAAGLIGCGAESGQGESGAIGESSEALTVSTTLKDTLTDTVPNPDVDKPRDFAASCVLHDSGANKDKMLVVGGVTAGGTYLSDAWLFDPSAAVGSQWTSAGSVSKARAYGKAIQDPANSNKCIIVGGFDGTNMVKDVDVYTLGTGFTTATTADDLNTARANFALVPCGSKLLAIGGNNAREGTNPGSFVNSIEIFSAGAWSASGQTLGTGRGEMAVGVLKKTAGGTDYGFLIAGGSSSGLLRSSALDFIKSTDACSNITDFNLSSALGANISIPSAGRTQAVSFPITPSDGNHVSFLIAGGDDGSTTALPTGSHEVDVHWANPNVAGNSTTTANAVAGLTGVRRPVLVNASTALDQNGVYILIGGQNGAAFTTNPLYTVTSNNVQEFSAGWTKATLQDSVPNALDRVGHVAEYLAQSGQTEKVFTTAGKSVAASTVDRVTTLAIAQ